jgi:DNA-binding response OmpR family regulator
MARVLLVEDEPNIASIIVFKLEREGHQVRWEPSASGVLAAAVEKPFKPTQLARLVAQLVPAAAAGPP